MSAMAIFGRGSIVFFVARSEHCLRPVSWEIAFSFNADSVVRTPSVDCVRLYDVSSTSFDVEKDDSYTGRARVAAQAGLASAALRPCSS